MKLSLIIPTHNRAEILARTLESVERQALPAGVEAELIVIANNCHDATVEVSEHAIARLGFPGRVVEEPVPGLSAARDRGVAESCGEICVLIDDDVAFEPGWLGEVAAFFDEHPHADIAGGRVTLWWEAVDRPDWFTPTLDSLLSIADLGDAPVELHNHIGIVGANFWFRRSVFDKIGGFRADLGRSGKSALGGEESEFIERAQRAGLRAFYTPNGALLHWVAPGRIERDYLFRIATGNARGRMRMKPPLSPAKWLRALVGHAYLWLAYRVRGLFTQITRGRNAATAELAISRRGWGGLQGLADRLTG